VAPATDFRPHTSTTYTAAQPSATTVAEEGADDVVNLDNSDDPHYGHETQQKADDVIPHSHTPTPPGAATAARTQQPHNNPHVAPATDFRPHTSTTYTAAQPSATTVADEGADDVDNLDDNDDPHYGHETQQEADDEDDDEMRTLLFGTTRSTTTTTTTTIKTEPEDAEESRRMCYTRAPPSTTTVNNVAAPAATATKTTPKPKGPKAASPHAHIKTEAASPRRRTRRATGVKLEAELAGTEVKEIECVPPPTAIPSLPRYLHPRQQAAFARIVARLIDGYDDVDTSWEKRDAILHKLMCLPVATLTALSGVSARKRVVPNARDADYVADAEEYTHIPVVAPAPHPPREPRPFEARMRTKAEDLARQGYLGKAAKILCNKDVPLPPLDVLKTQLDKLHPQSVLPMLDPKCVPPHLFIDPKLDIEQISKSGCHGKAPGPSGWTEELLHYVAIADEDSATGLALRAILEDIINGDVSARNADLLAASVLMALPKDDTKVRPIAMGEVLLRLATRICIKQYPVSWSEHQFAFRSGGAEVMAHELRSLVEKGYRGYSLDMANAYNTLSRVAFLTSCPLSLLPLAAMTYCRPGNLYLRQGKRIVGYFYSTTGVRQGDVLGPLLFAAAIEETLMLIAKKYGVKVLAYLDDVNILGTDPVVTEMARDEMLEMLAAVGLLENPSKRQIVSLFSPSPVKIVGAYVAGPEEAIQAALVSKVPEDFFLRLSHLHPTIAMLLLRVCGEPRFTFLARTHSPEQLKPAAAAMNRTSYKALASILALPLEDLMSEAAADSRFLASLPVKMGGLAVTDWEVLSPVAYRASSMGGSQKVMTGLLFKTALTDRVACAKHAAMHAAKAASAYLLLPNETAKPHPTAVIAATLQRINWAGNDERGARCRCGFEAERRNIWPHMAGCVAYPGSAVNGRHHALVRQLLLWCQDAGWAAQQEVVLDAKSRIDLLVDTEDRTVMVDVTVISPEAKTWAELPREEVIRRVKLAKQRTYGRFTSNPGELRVELTTFYMDVWGSLSAEATQFLHELVEAREGEGPTAAKMAHQLAALAVVWTGRTAHKAGLLRAWGADTSLSLFCTGGRGPNTYRPKTAEGTVGAEETEKKGTGTSATNTAAETEDNDEARKTTGVKDPKRMGKLEKRMFNVSDGGRPPLVHGGMPPGVAASLSIARGEAVAVPWVARFPYGGPLMALPRPASAGSVADLSRLHATPRGE